MKIVQINTVCGTGSTGKIALDLYRLAEEAGHTCYFAYGRGSSPADIKMGALASEGPAVV